MKKHHINFCDKLGLFLSVVICFSACSTKTNNTTEKPDKDKTAQSTYSNPLDVEFGDPYILNDGDGKYYMYGTGGGAKDGFAAYSSDDLVNWEFEGQVYRGNTDESWASKFFWAPEVYKMDGKYYMFFSAQWKVNPTNEEENFMIGVAVSDNPTGPFMEMYDRPIFDPGYPIIDANVYQENGKYYLYYSRACYKHPVESEVADWAKEKGWYDEIEESWVYGVELKPDFSGVIGEPVLCLRPPLTMDDEQAEWESRSVAKQEINRRWTEGSVIFKDGDTYYIMYSSNYYAGENYAVGYAIGKSPLGPFTKASNNPVLELNTHKGGEVTGTGHNNIVKLDNGEMYCVYHGRTKASGQDRVVFLDKMEIMDDGTLVVHGPTTSFQPLPLE
ncbi:glycoside hydrolase family 43 protein [Echinicola salinicaeni]|uniref:glycoside hydrolase family 43 protein n=1 Tax=Echinicola salinicaeni TaxID=2762757 RepID=UPI0016485DA7|nr:glycoside hydrolase family 43 protein [Echinicola salinicaeni]